MPRLTIEFPEKVNEMLIQLADKDQTTKVDVLRRALALYEYVHKEAYDKGMLLCIREPGGGVIVDIVLK